MNRVLMTIRGLGSLSRTLNALKYVIVVVLCAAAVTAILLNSYTDNLNSGLANNLIRLHVIANSDSPEDQALKREVRDSVLSYMKEELENSENIGQTKAIINNRLDDITAIAKETITRNGCEYDVKACLGKYPFPTKSYGDIALPAGSYQALRVVIGKGAGANWWCVLFPPLCFVDVTHGTVPDYAKENLKEALTEEEYSIVTSAEDESDIPIKIKFKIVELFQDSKVKFSAAINKLLSLPG